MFSNIYTIDLVCKKNSSEITYIYVPYGLILPCNEFSSTSLMRHHAIFFSSVPSWTKCVIYVIFVFINITKHHIQRHRCLQIHYHEQQTEETEESTCSAETNRVKTKNMSTINLFFYRTWSTKLILFEDVSNYFWRVDVHGWEELLHSFTRSWKVTITCWRLIILLVLH